MIVVVSIGIDDAKWESLRVEGKTRSDALVDAIAQTVSDLTGDPMMSDSSSVQIQDWT